jgi:hypothetical protein
LTLPVLAVPAGSPSVPGLGVDVDFYTGPVFARYLAEDETIRHPVRHRAGVGRPEPQRFAVSQLEAARSVAGMKSAAYVLLNYDDKVCSTFARPQRDSNGSCQGGLIAQSQPGGRWQVRQALAALGPELRHIAFVAIDVEWFTRGRFAFGLQAESQRRQRILDAIDEVQKAQQAACDLYAKRSRPLGGYYRLRIGRPRTGLPAAV